jgi:tetratricopeptide (TPR) repeat protein
MQMRSSTYRLFACLAVVALAGLPTVAAADVWSSCVKLSDDLAVAGCSRAIDSHQYTGRSLARLSARRGGAYQAQGDLDHAMADFNESMRVDPTYPSAYNNRGITWYRRGDFDRAIADYDQAIRLDPKYEYAYANRGAAWAAKDDLDRAIADYDQAIRLDPKYGHAYVNRGAAWGAKGDFDRAIADFDQAIRLDPKDAQAYTTAAWRGRRNAVCERHWPTSKCILNSLHPTQIA